MINIIHHPVHLYSGVISVASLGEGEGWTLYLHFYRDK